MEEQLTLEEILREGMIGNPNKELHSDDLQRAAERGDTEGKKQNKKGEWMILENTFKGNKSIWL